MRDQRLSPLRERDKRRTLEYWQNQPFGSVTVKSRRDDSTSATGNSKRSDVAPSQGSSMLPLDSRRCESGGTDAPTVTDNPTQGRPTPPREGNVPLAREAQRQTIPNHARPRENTSAPQPSVPVERSNNTGTDQSSSMDEEAPRTAPLEEEPLRNDEGRMCLLTSSCSARTSGLHTNPQLCDRPDSCPMLGQVPRWNLCHVLYEATLIRDEFRTILTLTYD